VSITVQKGTSFISLKYGLLTLRNLGVKTCDGELASIGTERLVVIWTKKC
jgi:hypothetical protein